MTTPPLLLLASPGLAEIVPPLPDTGSLVGAIPETLKGPDNALLGLEYWQWIGLFGVILIGLVVDLCLRVLLRTVMGVASRRLRRTLHPDADPSGQEEKDARARVARAVALLGMAVSWLLLLRLLRLPDLPEAILLGAAQVLIVLSGVWSGFRLADLVGDLAIDKAADTDTRIDDVVIPLLRKAVKLFVLVIGVVYAADALNIKLAPLLASLGIGGLAFAFAAKDTIENFFGSVAVLLDRPFSVGDWIVVGDVEGTVEELGFRSTRIRTFYNSQVTVPNATLVRATVDNYGRRKYRRWKTHLGLQYDTTPDKLVAFTEGVRELVRTHPYTRKDYYQVWMHQWSASSMDVLLYVFFEVPDWNTELRERERLFIDIVRLADALGVQFAFPTQTVHLFQEDRPPDPATATPQHAPPSSMTDRRAMVRGIRSAQSVTANQPWQNHKPGPVTYDQMGPTPIDEAGNEIPEPEEKRDPS